MVIKGVGFAVCCSFFPCNVPSELKRLFQGSGFKIGRALLMRTTGEGGGGCVCLEPRLALCLEMEFLNHVQLGFSFVGRNHQSGEIPKLRHLFKFNI